MAIGDDPHSILVVDDDPDIRAIAALALVDLGGLRAVFAANGPEARREARAQTPDLVLMDLHLADGEDGRALWRVLAGEEGAGKVVFVTAARGGEAGVLMAEPGCLGLITKPFDPLTLADSLRQLWMARS
ncbi:response regulator [Rhodospirillum rubrum]|uniref:Response regulator receiver domain protein (CheY) n=1 Tax=Rhodospirillum rubrum (strain ATCC 11170 / ATH 1.1.1 / DSM 467 / LMG 4362 / NCIMB 8255 / S1) TaxID=269796 RepID=Q2RS66_RHORT|nr:response regulator [Rhodospirillum rubrum]ABC23029.1 Response regulator receiver domain protein (CheY) [Rhodospirillum rubrum ATCC 11170]AEO48758.1 response regulator receiver domain-containing protein [Rhodospirillum rubrum F11]MBK5954656.1 response regulator [Rhodospirillum rubrum]QXG79013.1 response regulator [Rhodospirillum rubrum]HAQ01234.1 response regulator [Rhodospirillum rubrum]